MARDRNQEKQQWIGKGFNEKLFMLQKELEKRLKRRVKIAEVTEIISDSPKFRDLEKEILKEDIKNELKIKLDKKRI